MAFIGGDGGQFPSPRLALWPDACKPVLDLPRPFVGGAMRHWSELWLEFVDAGVAALEGRLRGRHCSERRGGGGGLSLRLYGWRGADGGGSWCWRCFDFGSSQIVVRRPNSGIAGGCALGSSVRIFPDESSAL
jgi:hypothetical protein